MLALTLLFFYKLAFTGMILPRGDVYAYFYPYWAARNAALINGHLPLWTPDLFMGAPLLANSQLGTFYPPNWLMTTLTPPEGIKLTLLAHIAWGLLGAYLLARRTVNLTRLPALLAASLFMLGGYVGAQVEHINQLQALGWMPWLFLLLHLAITPSPGDSRTGSRVRLRGILLLGIGLALQLLAGHPQTVFITALGLGVYALVTGFAVPAPLSARFRAVMLALIILACAGLIALLLASPQLVPTLELAGSSNRSGGMNPQQAMAFSWNPFVIGRGLLPSYDGLLFGEYVAYMGIIGLGLAVLGLFNSHQRRAAWIVLLVVGIGLALGLYNPLYWKLASLPGFSFFRVPARWLALFALAAAMLAGAGLQSLVERPPKKWLFGLIGLLIAALIAAVYIAYQTDSYRLAVDVIGPALPTVRTLMGWTVGIAVLFGALIAARLNKTRRLVPLLWAAAVLELFLAARVLAYNEVAPPEVYESPRFTISQLQAYADQQTPPGRFLSITNLLFDPGDVAALTSRYRDLGMSDLAIRIALVDAKMKETLAANLPLIWNLPSIDGFDGGVLPTGLYTAFTSLMLPSGELRTVDGRLREILAKESCGGACIPDQRWLNLTNTRYLITDKVYDRVRNGIFYDTQFERALTPAKSESVRDVLPFEADAVDVLYQCDNPICPAPSLTLTFPNSQTETPAVSENGTLDAFTFSRLKLTQPRTIVGLTLAAAAPTRVRAVTLVDTRTGDFQQVTLGPWKRLLSSDIKLYENLDVLPRAFIVHQASFVPDTWDGSEAALKIMADPNFDPAQSAVIHNSTAASGGRNQGEKSAAITAYAPERIEIQAETSVEGYLILTDSYFPGWTAAVNGQPTPIDRADVLFRAVRLPAGKSTVVFSFQPAWLPAILIFGVVAWSLALLMAVLLSRKSLKLPGFAA